VISLSSLDPIMPATPAITQIEHAIHLIRGQKVMLDSDLAAIYGVTTSRLNEQLKRNRKRFPKDFAFQLDAEEFAHLKSQIAISNLRGASLISQNATSKKGRGGRRKLPWVFTEHGALMLASVLSSDVAIEASVRVVRAFVRLRELMLANKELATKFNELEHRMDRQDSTIARLFDAIRQLLEPPPTAPKREIGFHVGEDAPLYGRNRKKS
jgi:hypothetical protein